MSGQYWQRLNGNYEVLFVFQLLQNSWRIFSVLNISTMDKTAPLHGRVNSLFHKPLLFLPFWPNIPFEWPLASFSFVPVQGKNSVWFFYATFQCLKSFQYCLKIVLISLLLTLNVFDNFFQCFYCLLWTFLMGISYCKKTRSKFFIMLRSI